MYRSIVSQAIYMFIVMIVLLFAGPTMFDIKYDMVREEMYTGASVPTFRTQHYTLMFHTFVLMQIFNMFNCRIIGGEHDNADGTDNQYNIFRRLHHNWWFILIVMIELNI